MTERDFWISVFLISLIRGHSPDESAGRADYSLKLLRWTESAPEAK